MSELEDRVLREIEKIREPETGMTVREMKLVVLVEEIETGIIKISFPSSGLFWPSAPKLATRFRKTAENVDGVNKVTVYCRGHTFSHLINRSVNA